MQFRLSHSWTTDIWAKKVLGGMQDAILFIIGYLAAPLFFPDIAKCSLSNKNCLWLRNASLHGNYIYTYLTIYVLFTKHLMNNLYAQQMLARGETSAIK